MAGGRENLNLQSETSEFMDQPSVQHEHVVTIPPATNASSIVSSSAATVGFQALNFPSIVPCEDVSTSGTANTQVRSRTPRRQRSRWSNPCSWLTFDICSTIIQIILLVVFLFVFRDEHPHGALRVWVIGYGVGCLAALPVLHCSYKHLREQSNRLPQTFSNSGESQIGRRQRFGKILKWLWALLHVFFVLWFGVGIGIVDSRWASRQALGLNRLCRILLVFTYFRFILPLTIYIVMRWCGVPSSRRVIVQEWPRRASANANANVISALPTFEYHACETLNQANKEDEDVRVSIGGDERVGALAAEVVECCICLDLYEDGVELKELPCTHHFHVKCIDQWLKINGSCPICKREVGTSNRAFAM